MKVVADLVDDNDATKSISVTIREGDSVLSILGEGYDLPIYLEYMNGELVLRAYTDINQEAPTHIVFLGKPRQKENHL